jgi:RhtB (resistance to homoserine/threonine) family protein
MVEHLPAFFAVSALVIVTPGQDTALTVRNTLVGGRGAGVATALGVAGGQAVWAVATSVGLSALLAASHPVFVGLRAAGAAYLVWLGVHALRDAFRPHAPADGRASPRPSRLSRPRAFRQGLLSNLGNPKMVVFFTSLFPQFLTAGGGFAVLLLLGLAFCAMTFTWLALYAAAVARARGWLMRSRVRRALDAVAGTVLVALGARLGASALSGRAS